MSTRPEPSLERLFNRIRQLEIQTPQGASGLLTKESRYVFNYHAIRDDRAVSLVMPARAESYASGELMGVFAMNRPEGYLRHIIEDRLKRLGAPSDMFLLYLAGENQIGRLTYTLPGERIASGSAERLEELLSSPSGALFERLIDRYALGSGISGIQPKALVPIEAESSGSALDEHTVLPMKTVIVKAEGTDYPGLARNEFACMSVAREAGLEVPPFWLSTDGKLFIMGRFDRAADGTAIGFEDMAVLTGRWQNKYQGSYEMVAKATETFAGEHAVEALRKLFDRVAISCSLRDGDAHLKNIGMLYEHPGTARRLAPVFDVVCTDVYPDLDGKLALKLNGSKAFPTTRELIDYGERLGVSDREVAEVFERIKTAYYRVVAALERDERFQADGFLASLRTAIERPGFHDARRCKTP